MAVNVISNLYSGGSRPSNANFAMLPAGLAASVVGYADHQRRRSYQVVRQMRFSPQLPYGGLGNAALTDTKDWDWYSNLVASGGNVAVDDVWNMIIIPPNTRVEYIAVQVFTGLAGLTFTADIHDAAGLVSGTVTALQGVLGPIGTAAVGPNLAQQATVLTATTTRYVGIHINTVPGTAGTAKLRGLDFAVQVEAVDWGSYDLNGNA